MQPLCHKVCPTIQIKHFIINFVALKNNIDFLYGLEKDFSDNILISDELSILQTVHYFFN